MKYFLIALANILYGFIILATTPQEGIGYVFIFLIAIILLILGFAGLVFLVWQKYYGTNLLPSILLKGWFLIIKNIDILLILGTVFRTFILQPFLIDGSSMEPDYHHQEFIMVDRISYYLRQPERGEVIIFEYPKNNQQDYIKRIIGLPGETVTIDSGRIFINNQLLDESYLSKDEQTLLSNNADQYSSTTLSQNEYFVLGDNRNHSSDSRDWGTVPRKNIIGHAWFVIFPIDEIGIIHHPKMQLNPFGGP